jgi:uncharacterized membrane protein YsdA (DUF1294 family)/cold shock CspA family protein
MRFEGTITQWNQDRGFGFIEPTLGGQDIFVHICALPSTAKNAPLHRVVSFEVEQNRNGEKRAFNLHLVHAVPPRLQPRATASNRPPVAGWFAIPFFACVYLVSAWAWHVPKELGFLYGGSSFACCVAYALDKSAAQAGRWRISENTLLMLGLIGGWPGAIVAQQLLRHKTSKRSFRIAFWVTVVLNIAVFVLLVSPRGRALLHLP